MTKLFLSLHVLAAILAVGPVAVAASVYPRYLRTAQGAPDDESARAALRLLIRICRVYAIAGIAVPVFGFATAGPLGVLGTPWLIISIVLTAVAALVLGLLVLPAQQAGLDALTRAEGTVTVDTRLARRIALYTGAFNLLWAVVTVLMIVRPGSTTGV